MSVQFGKCNFDGRPVAPEDLDQVRPVLAPYGPDGERSIRKDNFGILYFAFHTTKESRREIQPIASASESVLTWDGRLDNREELIRMLAHETSGKSTDPEIVAAAYERWGTDSFAKLIGDWALSIWDARTRSLLLAKDFLGARQLYYSIDKHRVTWCTILDPLVLFADHLLKLEEEYIAGWLSSFPSPHLTPYVGIHAVPPSSFVRVTGGTRMIQRYWDFNPSKKTVYHEDSEYEEHFRIVFATSVRRRLRSDSPVLAELSGGMDSSSIVCVADDVIAGHLSETPRLDTISYYNDSEPNWNERPYFTCVEQKRGRTGCHVDLGSQASFNLQLESNSFAATPNSVGSHLDQPSKQFALCIASNQNRALLTGIGGDEVTGGLPTPVPELKDALASARFVSLAHRLKLWALQRRKPWFHLLLEATRGFLPPAMVGVPAYMRPPSWLHRTFVKRYRSALTGYPSRVKLLGPLPSFQENLSILDALRRQLACDPLPFEPTYEKRYPYLDRDLLEFTYSCPREQLVRPGHRRSLMRRSLAGIVPEELLNRKRKAFVARSPLLAISKEQASLCEMIDTMLISSLGIVDPKGFYGAVRKACQGQEVAIVPLMRALGVECWLRSSRRNVILAEGSLKSAHGSAAVREQRSGQSTLQRSSQLAAR